LLIIDPVEFRKGMIVNQFELYPWPISDDEFKQYFGGVFDLYIDCATNESAEFSDLLMSDTRYILTLLNLIHINAAANLSISNWGSVTPDISIEALQEARRKDIDIGDINSDTFANAKRLGRAIFLAGKYTKLFSKSWSMKSIWLWADSLALTIQSRYDGERGITQKFRNTRDVGLGNPRERLRRKFLKGKGINLVWIEDLVHFLSYRSIGHLELPNEVAFIVGEIFRNISQMPGLYTANLDLKRFEDSWKERLTILWNLYWAYRSGIWRKVETLHLVGSGNTTRKLLALAWQREGIKTFNYNHGGNLHLSPQQYYFLTNEATWGNLVCPNRAIARNMKNTYSDVSLGRNFQKPNYLFPESEEEKKTPIPLSVPCDPEQNSERVLLCGFAMHQKRFLDGDGLLFYFRLDLELRIVLQLRDLGYEVTYKAHPEYSGITDGIFRDNGINVASGVWEEVWGDYHKLIFTDFSTTAFGFSLTTDKPIILTLRDGGGFPQDALSALEKRVNHVPITWSNHNRLNYDQEVLTDAVKAIDRKGENTEFWDKYVRYESDMFGQFEKEWPAPGVPT